MTDPYLQAQQIGIRYVRWYTPRAFFKSSCPNIFVCNKIDYFSLHFWRYNSQPGNT